MVSNQYATKEYSMQAAEEADLGQVQKAHVRQFVCIALVRVKTAVTVLLAFPLSRRLLKWSSSCSDTACRSLH